MKKQDPRKRPVTVFLDQSDFNKLTEICKSRNQSRADFLRAAISVDSKIPYLNTRPLVGACLQKHLARLEREKSETRKTKERKR